MENLRITKPIRLIEFFAGYGSQHLALKYLNKDVASWKICEWAIKSIQAYKDAHYPLVNDDYTKGVSDEFIYKTLYDRGISSNYNEPMTYEQIKRLGSEKARKIFNNIIITKNLVNISTTTAKGLGITDRDKYTYIMTYSFPCQDLSNAGLRKGMVEDSGTRSGLLWEVGRILEECDGNLPQILLMENVPQVHGKKNINEFNRWIEKLKSLGYTNYWKDLNAKDFGIPQNRKRCFMVSVLGDYDFEFPKEQELQLKLKDLLEDEVDEKYYLSDKMKTYIASNNEKWTGNNNKSCINKDIASTLNTGEGSRRCDASNYICKELPNNFNLKQQMCDGLIKSGKIKENDVIRHSYSTSRMNGEMKDIQQNNISPTLDTRCDCLGVCVKDNLCEHKNILVANGKNMKFKKSDICGSLLINSNFTGCGVQLICKIANKNLKAYGCSTRGRYDRNGEIKQKIEISKKEISNTLTASFSNKTNQVALKTPLRIRKLTPKECFRLMGVRDDDFEKVAKNQSNASLYHLAGDSIVVNVLMEIFKNMF